MPKPFGRIDGWCLSSVRSAGALTLLAALTACSSNSESATGNVPSGEPATAAPLGTASAPLVVNTTPAGVAYAFDLEGQHFELSLQRSAPPTTSSYKAYRLGASGQLVEQAPTDLGCTYRGAAELAGAANPNPGFAVMSVCASSTGHAAGDAASGVLSAGGRYWRLTPDPTDQDASDGIDHFAQPLHRPDSPGIISEPPRRITLARLPETPAPREEFREGTEFETKYIDLIAVNDSARVAQLGDDTEQTTIQFVETMNALLEGSGISPRVRVTLRAQVLFDQDPYGNDLVFDGNEVDNDSLLNEFLNFGVTSNLPVHDEHMLLSGLDFVDSVVGYAGLSVACTNNANGFIVQAGDADGGFAVLSAVHEMGHTLGMNHDDGSSPQCPQSGFIMAAVGCGNCPGAEQAQFSPCSLQQFQAYLDSGSYTGCADDVPQGALSSCGDGVVQDGETCDCGGEDCSDIDPCCDGATCQLNDGAECSDFNDGCCLNCAVVQANENVTCRIARSECDIPEVCGGSKECPSDSFEAAGADCQDQSGNDGTCYFGDCRSRASQCEQLAESQVGTPNEQQFQNFGGPPAQCPLACNNVVCGNGGNQCITIGNVRPVDGVACNGGQCVNGQCVTTIDQCPNDPNKEEPGDCGCGVPDGDSDNDGSSDCVDECPSDAAKTAPGECGCGVADGDSDNDGSADCVDECPSDAAKTAPGDCGCGQPDIDSDNDGSADCVDECPQNPAISVAGACGCDPNPLDSDNDGTPDCDDECPNEAGRTEAPCLPPGGDPNDSSGGGGNRDDGGCSITAVGATPAAGGAHGAAGRVLGGAAWLALVMVPVLRRRRRAA